MSFLKKLFGQKSGQEVAPKPGPTSAQPSGVNVKKSETTPVSSQATGAKQLLETLDNSSATASQKASARKELIGMGGAALAPILDFIEAGHRTFEAVGLLAEIGPPAVEPMLAKLDTCGHWSFLRGVEALGKIRDPRAVPFLISQLQLQGASSDKEKRRGWAADALGAIGDASAVPALIAVLEVGDDFNDQTGRNAAKALGRIEDPRAIEPLLTIFRQIKLSYSPHGSSPEELQRGRPRIVAAAWALAMLGVREVEDAISHMITHARDPYRLPHPSSDEADELREVLKRLRSTPPPRSAAGDVQSAASSIVHELERATDPKKKCELIKSLGKHRGDEVLEALMRSVKDPDEKVRLYAVGTLQDVGDARAVEPLIELLMTDTAHQPCYYATKALARFKTPRAIAGMISALESQKGDLSELALQLGEVRAREAVDALCKLADGSGGGSDYARRHAVMSLANIGDRRAISALTKALGDADEGVRERAQKALKELS